MSDHEGLTRPLINNIGGVIDQDAPSADQMTGGHDENMLDNAGSVEGGRAAHVTDLYHDDTGNVIPDHAGLNPGGDPLGGSRINPD